MSGKSAVAFDPAADGYAPGLIRQSSDFKFHPAVVKFLHQHPEYEKLGVDGIVQAMSTYLTDEEAEERRRLADEGVPLDWRPHDHEDDVLESLGRF